MFRLLKFLKQSVNIESAENYVRAEKLLESLGYAEPFEVEWYGRYSHSGKTFYVRGFKARLETSRHFHDLDCKVIAGRVVCDWYVDGEYLATVEITRDDPLLRKILKAIEFAMKTTKEDENKIMIYKYPHVELE